MNQLLTCCVSPKKKKCCVSPDPEPDHSTWGKLMSEQWGKSNKSNR